MDRCGLHRFVDEVRIIIGPKFDMLIKLDDDRDDLTFIEELVEHEVGKPLMKSKNLMCISLPVQAKDRRFILDSGSGHDLISARKAERMNLKQRTCDPIMFHTANGSTATQTEAEIDLGTFDVTSHAYVLGRHSVRDVSWETMHGRRILLCMAIWSNAFHDYEEWRTHRFDNP